MIPNDLKCIGIKDMADEQIEAMLRVIGHALSLADAAEDAELFGEVFEDCNELVLLLGGGGIQISLQAHITDQP